MLKLPLLRRLPRRIATTLIVLAFLPGLSIAADLEFRDNDRVVLLGGTLIEREQTSGYWETAWTTRSPAQNVIFRNLGWSADTVWVESRAGFGTPEKGFEELRELLGALAPTLIIVNYGANESFEGEEGLVKFGEGLRRMVAMLQETKARVALVAPTPWERATAPFPSVDDRNRQIDRYCDPIRELASVKSLPFIDFGDNVEELYRQADARHRITDNGMHFTPFGYWRTARLWDKAFDWSASKSKDSALLSSLRGLGVRVRSKTSSEMARVKLDLRGDNQKVDNATMTDFKKQADGARFKLKLNYLPSPLPPAEHGATPPLDTIRIEVAGLAAGDYELLVDGTAMALADAPTWEKGVSLSRGPDFDQVELLRRTIARKNELFFHRWRPQNITYLSGIRKYEQGNNAKEIVQFDPLVAEQEALIEKIRQPREHQYELRRRGGGAK